VAFKTMFYVKTSHIHMAASNDDDDDDADGDDY
jgi:hypothetical protein